MSRKIDMYDPLIFCSYLIYGTVKININIYLCDRILYQQKLNV